MTFEGRVGTRGVKQLGGPVIRTINKVVAPLVRLGMKQALGFHFLILTTIGAKSGQTRSTPLACFPDGDGWLVVASAFGSVNNPAWYYNVAAHPERVSVQVGRRHYDVVVDELHGDDRELAWKRITSSKREFAGYAEKTDRLIPVLRLTPR